MPIILRLAVQNNASGKPVLRNDKRHDNVLMTEYDILGGGNEKSDFV
jgi:hypothetical protein